MIIVNRKYIFDLNRCIPFVNNISTIIYNHLMWKLWCCFLSDRSSGSASVLVVSSKGNAGFSRDADISGKWIFRVSANKALYLEKYLTVLLLAKSNVSPVLSNIRMGLGKYDGTNPFNLFHPWWLFFLGKKSYVAILTMLLYVMFYT